MWKNNIPSAHLSGPWILFNLMTSKSFSVTLKVRCATEQSYEAVKIVFSQILTVHTTYSWWSSWTSKSPWDLFFVQCKIASIQHLYQYHSGWEGVTKWQVVNSIISNISLLWKYISFFAHKFWLSWKFNWKLTFLWEKKIV